MTPEQINSIIAKLQEMGVTPKQIQSAFGNTSNTADPNAANTTVSTGGNPTATYSTFQGNNLNPVVLGGTTDNPITDMGENVSGNWFNMDAFRTKEQPVAPQIKTWEIDPNQPNRQAITPEPEDVMDKKPEKDTPKNNMPYFPFIGAGMDLESRLFATGQGIGKLTAKDEQGNRLYTGAQRAGAWGQTVGGAGSFLLGSSRILASGAGYGKRNAYIDDWYNKRQQDQYYTPNQQYKNANYLGGISPSKYGGTFEEGGEFEEDSENFHGGGLFGRKFKKNTINIYNGVNPGAQMGNGSQNRNFYPIMGTPSANRPMVNMDQGSNLGGQEFTYNQNPAEMNDMSQFSESRYAGGTTPYRLGGLFEEGGEQEEMMEQPQVGPQEMAENEGQQMNPQVQQVMMQVAQAIEDGESPQMIIQALMSKGMSQEQATQIVTQVVQRIQQHEQEQAGESSEGSEEQMMRKGGRFNYKVSDHIKFKSGGVMREGKIKKIENGKIFL
jgi:uncharacterized protein YoaH (UPF0181 family)